MIRRRDAARGEAAIDEATQAPVIRRIGGDHHRRSQEPVPGERAAVRSEVDAAALECGLQGERGEIFRVVEGVELSYQQYLEQLLSSPEVQSDSEKRFEALEEFRDFVRQRGVVDPQLVERLAARVTEIFQTPRRMVRFRSSSNMEDALEFNGAGLYQSTSVCVADTQDQDEVGP